MGTWSDPGDWRLELFIDFVLDVGRVKLVLLLLISKYKLGRDIKVDHQLLKVGVCLSLSI